MGEKGLAVGGVYLAQTAMLVLYWHPFMAFVVPLLAGELLLTSSTETLDALPGFAARALRTRWIAAAAIFGAAFIGVSKAVNSPTPGHALASILSSAAVPGLLMLLWLRAPGSVRRAGLTLRELLPDGRQGLVVGLLLAAFYAVTGLLIRPGSMPRTIVPHLSVAALYALFCGLAAGVLARSARRDRAVPPAGARSGAAGSRRPRPCSSCPSRQCRPRSPRSRPRRRLRDGRRPHRHGRGAGDHRRRRCGRDPPDVISSGPRRRV